MHPMKSVCSLTVLDLGVGMAAAIAVKLFADLGMRVLRIEPPQGDPFREIYAAYDIWRSAATRIGLERIDEVLATADVCVIGGEDFPGLTWKFDGCGLSARHPRLIVLDLRAYAKGGEEARPAVDLLVQARSGLCFEQFSARPVHFAFPAPTYGAAMQGAMGVGAALLERERSGRGQVVSTSLQQGALMFLSVWMTAERSDAAFERNIPKDSRPLIVRCADGKFVHFSTGAAPKKAFDALGIVEKYEPHSNWFGDVDLIARYCAKYTRAELLAKLAEADLAADLVLAPGECWDHPQTQENGVIARNFAGWRYVGCPMTIHVGEAGAAPRTDSAKEPKLPTDDAPPLQGLRIVDLGHFVAGPYASKLLAELGADVVKVEPLTGDMMRRASYPAVFSANRCKRSLCVDAKSDIGHDILQQLSATANAVHHNFRPGVAKRLSLDPDTLRKYRPDIVTLQSSAYGSSGPRVAEPGFDPIMQAFCGHEVRAGGAGNDPLWYRLLVVDYSAGALGAIGLLFGLLEQQRSACPVALEVNLLDTGLFLLSELVRMPSGQFVGAPLTSVDRTGFHPAESLYRTRDGWVAIAARSEGMARRLVASLDLLDQLGARDTWGKRERELIAQALSPRTTAEVIEQLTVSDVWVEPCVRDGWTSLRGNDRSSVVTVPDEHYGRIECVGSLVAFSRSKLTAPTMASAPQQGQHTRELLLELGYTTAQVSELLQRGIVAEPHSRAS